MMHNPSVKGWMNQMHRQQHVLHMPHPIHWIHEHPGIQALLIASLIVLLIIGLGSLIGAGIHQNGLSGFNTLDYPFGPAY